MKHLNRHPRWVILDFIIAWIVRLMGLCFFGYAFYALWVGEVNLVTRYRGEFKVGVEVGIPFLIGIAIYIVGGGVCFWIAKAIATNKKAS